jgi:hypothetical protein
MDVDMWEPKPHVVAFVAAAVLIAGVSTVAENAGQDAVAIDEIAAGVPGGDGQPDGDATSVPQPTDGPTGGLPGGPASPVPTAGAATSGPAAGGAAGGEDASNDGGSTSSGGNETAPTKTEAPKPTASTPTAPTAPNYSPATLYSGADAKRGITADQITMCGHAALALGAAFDTSREDLNVYWDMVNDMGGVIGRDVRMSWEDDAYVASQAVTAATTCADKDPFMILGGIGFDQIPGVRDWAEANDELYLHHIAVAPTQVYDHSFSLSPTVQLVGEESGNYIAREYRSEKVGVIYRGTDNWTPGSDAGMKVMTDRRMDVTGYEIVQNQGVYAQELNQMKLSGTQVVWIWENALNAAQIINQASEIDFYPTWVVFPFQTTIDILTEPEKHTIEGVASWGSYAPGGYGDKFAEFGLDVEIKAFEAAYAKYRPDTTPNDLLWQVWVGNKVLHQMFTDCGVDCDRNRFAGMMLSGYQTTVKPGCLIDFGDDRGLGGHHGGFRFFSQRLFQADTGPAYETTAYCVKTLR